MEEELDKAIKQIAATEMLVRKVTVNRSQSFKKMLQATGRMCHVNEFLFDDMPKGEGEEIEVFFFNLGRYVDDTDLENEYDLRGLKSADPASLTKVNEDDPQFADTYPNITHWKNEDYRWWNFISFARTKYNGRLVRVRHNTNPGYGGRWWHAGIRK